MKKHIHLILVLLIAGVQVGCEGFLDEKPSKDLAVPQTLEDFQALLDNDAVFNYDMVLPFAAGDDYYTTEGGFLSFTQEHQNLYKWKEDIFESDNINFEYLQPYNQIFYSNIILEGLDQSPNKESRMAKELEGAAKFSRAYAYLALANTFAPLLNEEDHHKYVAVKMDPNINTPAVPKTNTELLSIIIRDLEQARELLPAQSGYPTRPTKVASDALFARTYLFLEDYEKALEYADLVIQAKPYLMDYNEIYPSYYPFERYNIEVIYHSRMVPVGSVESSTMTLPDMELVDSFEENDLRKELFLTTISNGTLNFTGSYTGDYTLFSGLAVNEIYLIRAECRVRTGDLDGAVEDLNLLLLKRYQQDEFQPLHFESADGLLIRILAERRKELMYRGIRWVDLKRFNNDERFAKTLVRELGDEKYFLEPKSPRYVIPIPLREIIFEGRD